MNLLYLFREKKALKLKDDKIRDLEEQVIQDFLTSSFLNCLLMNYTQAKSKNI